MKLIGRKKLDDFKNRYADVRSQLDAWEAEVLIATWSKPMDVKQRYASASILSDNQIVFNLKGNKYRLLVQVSYKNTIVFIKNIGTHDEYMNWRI